MHPVTRALRLHEMAEEHAGSGRLAEAESCCYRALGLLKFVCGARHPDVAAVLCTLGQILGRSERWLEAESAGKQALEIIENAAVAMERRESDRALLQALALLGNALRRQCRYAEAEAPLRRAVAVAGEYPRTPMLLAEACNHLGLWCKGNGNFLEAEMHYRRALVLTECTVGRNSLMAATIYRNLSALEHARGRYDRGLLPAKRAHQIRSSLLGADHPDTVADAVQVAEILDGLGRHSESEIIYRRALEIFERHYGAGHYHIAVTLHHLAGVERAAGRMDEAEALYRRALSIKETLLGPRHPETAATARKLAAVLRDRKRITEARQLIERVLGTLNPAHC